MHLSVLIYASNLISVIGIKYIIDVVTGGEHLERIVYAVLINAVVIVTTEEQIRHENAVPAIVSKENFDKVQFLLLSKKKDNVRATFDKPYHRYTGLIKCGDCGASFS